MPIASVNDRNLTPRSRKLSSVAGRARFHRAPARHPARILSPRIRTKRLVYVHRRLSVAQSVCLGLLDSRLSLGGGVTVSASTASHIKEGFGDSPGGPHRPAQAWWRTFPLPGATRSRYRRSPSFAGKPFAGGKASRPAAWARHPPRGSPLWAWWATSTKAPWNGRCRRSSTSPRRSRPSHL